MYIVRFLLLFILFPYSLYGQDYGFKHILTTYKGDTVDILIKSKAGEENKRKPLFLFCQGSLPIPLIIPYNQNGRQGIYSVFPFNPDSLSNDYHLAIIGKPYVPLIVHSKSLGDDLVYRDSIGQYPEKYITRNLLDYYVKRNEVIIRFLFKQSWISQDGLVIAGHSEGSTIAARLAITKLPVTALIYSGGNPMGRIMTIIERSRAIETDTSQKAETDIDHWKKVVADPENMEGRTSDTHQTTWQFSQPPIQYLEKVRVPVFVTYGTKDAAAPFNDYLRVEMIRQGKKNFTFKAYIGTEHNFFPLKPDGSVNYDIFNWDKVAADWLKWLRAVKQ